ncbi:tripartite tricarboxylate transporter TctB family protein [Salisediminibacterium halotolerans]|uniref:Uncharacterized protein n=1 Tax=Salisediminibacterium halotolerans TaxID=517425 RepID=A0A1H9UHT9_9BACI|nr:tripartite tricarboxylate transporter TctB family protein [Salisediminibacterium haloalkalitolerans]SES08942.1 hypothetical protein SAMN05444126_11454 [Salisediminibacterium haloalkalitolerans]
MWQMILVSAVLALLFLPFHPEAWKQPMFRKWIPSRYFAGIIYGGMLFYVGLLDQSLTAVLSYYIPVIGIGLIADYTLVFMFIRTFRKQTALIGAGIGAGLIVLLGVFWALQPLFLADSKYNIADGEEVTIDDLEPVNEEHIPVVPRSYAEYRSDVLMGQLENQAFYNLGTTRIQEADGSLYWVTPIEYDGFFRWIRSDAAPGYIRVSAENPRQDPELVQAEMTYVPSAFFHENIDRHVRAEFPDVVMLDTHFEIDSEGNPYYIVSYGDFTEFRRVADVDGVIIVDPETGELSQYEADEAPEWVNRVYPPHIAEERNRWFGIYKQGIINRFFGRQGLTEPTQWQADDTVTGVVDNDLNLTWFTDHMRLTDEGEEGSNSMIGFTMFNARTGELDYYRDASGALNGRTAMNLAERTFRRDDYVAGTPSLYNMYGQYTWIVPLMDRNNVLREIMLVNSSDENVYGYGSTKQEAFSDYQMELTTETDEDVVPGEYTDLIETEETVDRVYQWDREDSVTVRFTIEGSDTIYSVSSNSYPNAVFLESGDNVAIAYMDTGEEVQSLEEFELLDE